MYDVKNLRDYFRGQNDFLVVLMLSYFPERKLNQKRKRHFYFDYNNLLKCNEMVEKKLSINSWQNKHIFRFL